jgi:hypothetical protein
LAKGQGGLRQHGFGPPVDVTERIERSSVSSAGAIVHAIAQRPAARGVECPQALLRWADAR